MPTCPSGHTSAADDYCDVCGLPIGASAPDVEEVAQQPSRGTAPEEPAAPATSACPNCNADNPPNALFCEACGYDYTTGSMPRPVTPPSLESMLNISEHTAEAASPTPSDAAAAEPAAPAAPLAPPLAEPWVAEVWIDPDWYTAQESDDPLPSAGVPVVVQLKTTSVLVGRTSRSRAIHPDIDLSTDSGISRRHCQFTTDGTRWWVEDLGSSNGTYVGSITATLPKDPIPAGEKREIGVDDRIYLGAWTRIVIRKAEPGEV